mgnify:CR=1 FL=1
MDTSSYFDFASLAALKGRETLKQPESSKPVLEKFEALFIDQMLQSMRKATARSELFDSERIKLYESLFDKEISEELAKSGGLGLTKSLEQQLGIKTLGIDNTGGDDKPLSLERANRSFAINKSKAMALYSSRAADL